jgi:bifunctional DNA-binding transcriptional regulator/antitoxin component of YhaV-PrlF toxin-antitoxin module
VRTKVRKIGTGYGVLIPKKNLDQLGARENDAILIRRIEKPVKDIRGILKQTNFKKFERGHKKGPRPLSSDRPRNAMEKKGEKSEEGKVVFDAYASVEYALDGSE